MAVIKWDFVNEIYKPNLCPSYHIFPRNMFYIGELNIWST